LSSFNQRPDYCYSRSKPFVSDTPSSSARKNIHRRCVKVKRKDFCNVPRAGAAIHHTGSCAGPRCQSVCVCVRGSVCEGETESNACNPINMNWTAHKSCCPPNTKHFVRERSQIEDLCPILLAYVKLTPTVLCKYRMCAKSKAWQS
jgi:hypothetical protein